MTRKRTNKCPFDISNTLKCHYDYRSSELERQLYIDSGIAIKNLLSDTMPCKCDPMICKKFDSYINDLENLLAQKTDMLTKQLKSKAK